MRSILPSYLATLSNTKLACSIALRSTVLALVGYALSTGLPLPIGYGGIAVFLSFHFFLFFVGSTVYESHGKSAALFEEIKPLLKTNWDLLPNGERLQVYPLLTPPKYLWLIHTLWPDYALREYWYELTTNRSVGTAYHKKMQIQYLFLHDLHHVRLAGLSRQDSALFAIYHELGHIQGNDQQIDPQLEEAHADAFAYRQMIDTRQCDSAALLDAILQFRQDSYHASTQQHRGHCRYANSYLFFKLTDISTLSEIPYGQLVSHVQATLPGSRKAFSA